jgi:gas vesicle protein
MIPPPSSRPVRLASLPDSSWGAFSHISGMSNFEHSHEQNGACSQIAFGNNDCNIFDIVDHWILAGDSRCPQERKGSVADEVVNRNTAAALIAGALLGAGVTLLFAPQSGRKTRRYIRHFTERVGKKAEAARLELQRSIDKIIGDVEEKLREGLVGGMDWTDDKIADLRRGLDAAGKSIAREIEKIQST